jgi:hypothetical protein
MRRAVLAAIAIGIAVMWAAVPYGEKPGNFDYKTIGGGVLNPLRELSDRDRPARAWEPVDALLLPAAILAAFGPLYPAMQAALLLVAPEWFASRRRWVWFAEGVLLLISAPLTRFSQDWSLSDFNWGGTEPPRLFAPYWLLPGFAALAGLLALAIGVAPKSRFARFVLG